MQEYNQRKVECELDRVFATPVSDGVPLHAEIWLKMKPMTIELMRRLSHKVVPDWSVVDLYRAKLLSWKDGFGKVCTGMNQRSGAITGLSRYGAVRAITPNYWISEGSFWNTKEHGLER